MIRSRLPNKNIKEAPMQGVPENLAQKIIVEFSPYYINILCFLLAMAPVACIKTLVSAET